MSRYFTKRTFSIHLLAIAAIAVCLQLSNWQWGKAHYSASIPATGEVVSFEKLSPLRDFLPPTSVGVKTVVTGTWQPNGRLLFPGRPVDGKQLINPNPDSHSIVSWAVPIGSWVVDVLTLEDGSSVGVVRGWAPLDAEVPPISGPASISGVMQPSEDALGTGLLDLPKYISTNEIIKVADSNLHDGYLVSDTPGKGLEQVKPIFDGPQKVSLNWRNVVYTGNWIVFALIIAGMWWRIIQDELAQQEEESK